MQKINNRTLKYQPLFPLKVPELTGRLWRVAVCQKGFTLIELAVVVLIISLFAVFTVPRITNIGQLKLNKTGRNLARTITYLNTQAMATREFLQLEFDVKSGEYHINFLNNEGEFEPTSFPLFEKGKLPRNIRIKEFTTLFNGSLIGQTAWLHFLPEGFAEKAVIVLSDRSDRIISLIVDPLTGRVKVEKGETKFEYVEIEA